MKVLVVLSDIFCFETGLGRRKNDIPADHRQASQCHTSFLLHEHPAKLVHTTVMAPSLTSIPNELQVAVFGNTGDLDDSLHLSQTCSSLRAIFSHHQKAIKRQIIVSLRNIEIFYNY